MHGEQTELLLQLRHPDKDVFPICWISPVQDIWQLVNQSKEGTRELEEELGTCMYTSKN